MKHCRTLIPLVVITLIVSSSSRGQESIPPGAEAAKVALENSPRHGEFVDIPVSDRDTPLRAYVVYPETRDEAPVVIVIHEIFGLTDWVRAVADQLAADGFIAIAPDLLSGMGEGGKGTEGFASRDDVTKAIRGLEPQRVDADLDAAREYGAKLPASNGRTATIGFCWGGAVSFRYAANSQLDAAVVYYGTSPDERTLRQISAPVLGLYGSDDARVNKTIEPAADVLKQRGKTYTHHIYEGAGHGFLRQQEGREGANERASRQAWPETVKFLREHTGK